MNKFKNDFTLGELLMTMAIGAILTSIVVVSLTNVLDRSCVQNAFLKMNSAIAPGNQRMDEISGGKGLTSLFLFFFSLTR